MNVKRLLWMTTKMVRTQRQIDTLVACRDAGDAQDVEQLEERIEKRVRTQRKRLHALSHEVRCMQRELDAYIGLFPDGRTTREALQQTDLSGLDYISPAMMRGQLRSDALERDEDV